ncbi:MAG: UMP kinase [Aestuariivirgaceae bacterium]
MPKLRFSRALVKISGEVLVGSQGFGIDLSLASRIAAVVKRAVDLGAEIALVIGGGNIFRGIAGAAAGLDRARADYMGMLATVMNALAMQGALDRQGLDARVMSAIPMPTVCEPFQHDAALDHLRHRRVVLFAAGTGNPYFTTDTAASLRAVEMKCDVMLKGTSVDGIYAADPKTNPDAERFETLTYHDVVSRNLKVMDTAAIALARDNRIPVIVFSIRTEGALPEVLKGQGRFTIVKD